MKFYGIRHKQTKIPVYFILTSNESGECVDITVKLSSYKNPDRIWLVRKQETAKNVLKNESNSWFNADWEHPQKDDEINSKNFEVFEIEV